MAHTKKSVFLAEASKRLQICFLAASAKSDVEFNFGNPNKTLDLSGCISPVVSLVDKGPTKKIF